VAFWIHVTPRGRRKRVRIAGDAEALAARLQELATGDTAH
jgi:hypothetical protein